MKFSKPLLYVSIAASLFSVACSKNMSPATGENNLTGGWQWVRSDGGFGYHIHDTPASTGKNIELRFSDADGYAFYTNGALTSQGTYKLEKKQCIHDKAVKTLINFSGADTDLMIEKMDGGTMELSDEHYDGIGSVYQRKASATN